MNKRTVGLAIAACVVFNSSALAVSPGSSARIIPLDAKAWSGSSVNVLANVRQTLFTEGVIQYPGFYLADGALMLARCRIMNREWWADTAQLYRPAIGMYFRADSFLDLRERNGKIIHWARGRSYGPAVVKGWNSLTASVNQDGKLEKRAADRRHAACVRSGQQRSGCDRCLPACRQRGVRTGAALGRRAE